MVATGHFIGCVSRRALTEQFGNGRLVALTVPELDLNRRFYLVTNRRKHRTPGIGAFVRVCEDFAANRAL
jgi:DNA-binding transcriptional LysR family regulator